jgi:hypothetical protein
LERTPGIEGLHVARVVGLLACARQHFKAEWSLALIHRVHFENLSRKGGCGQAQSGGDRKEFVASLGVFSHVILGVNEPWNRKLAKK